MICFIFRKPELFPDETLPDKIFNGTAFQELPIISIRTSKNNTIMSLTNAEGKLLIDLHLTWIQFVFVLHLFSLFRISGKDKKLWDRWI